MAGKGDKPPGRREEKKRRELPPGRKERIGRLAEQRAGPIVRQALGPIRLLFEA